MNYSEQEAYAFLETLFPGGLKDPSLIAELCPDGWEKSPLFACLHPSPEIRYREHLHFTRNLNELAKLRKKDGQTPSTPEPEPELSYEAFLAENPPDNTPLTDADRIDEPARLLGLCLWDIFSDNHEVIAPDGRVVDLGSFRGSAGTISDFFESQSPEDSDPDDWGLERGFGYMDFYLGTIWLSSRADLTPAYQLLFRKLYAIGADWHYAFPRIHLVDFSHHDTGSTGYDNPSAAFQREAEQKARDEETAKLRRQLDRDTQSAKRHARAEPPPATVKAYQSIYHQFPQGWPPDPYT